jgi:hypothetical protein
MKFSFLFVPLDPAYKAGLAGHLPAKPVDNSTTRTIKLPHLFILFFVTFYQVRVITCFFLRKLQSQFILDKGEFFIYGGLAFYALEE